MKCYENIYIAILDSHGIRVVSGFYVDDYDRSWAKQGE
jgi:hypothetical protein